MRILLIDSYFYPHQGGSQKYAEELYSRLLKIDPAVKVDVIAYNTTRAKPREEYRGLTIYRVPCFQILPDQFALPNYFDLWQTIKMLTWRYKYDFVNSQNRFFDHSWWTPFLAKHIGAKSILTDHCADYPKHRSKFVSFVAKGVDNFLVPFIANKYDLVTVTNKATKKFLESLGIRKTSIVYGGVDTQFFLPGKTKRARRLPKISRRFSSSDMIVTFVGRMIPTKGPQILFQVAKSFEGKYPNVYFIFAGDGSLFRALSRYKRKNIFLTGSLDKAKVAKLLANSDVVVHPSVHHEGFPNVILEAGAAGSAVIATDMGGARELIFNNKTGLLVKPIEDNLRMAILQLIRSKIKRDKFGKALRKRVVEHFDWGLITEDFQQLLHKINYPNEKNLTINLSKNVVYSRQ